MTINEFTKKVFEKKELESKTDEIFRFIEGDKELMHDYLKLIENNKLNVLNSLIAKAIKKEYGLKPPCEKERNPKSVLIQSFSSFQED